MPVRADAVPPARAHRYAAEPPGLRAAVALAVLTRPLRHRVQRPARQRGAPASMPDSFAPLVKQVLPAVVNIAVTETVSGGEVLSDLPPELRDTPLGREFRRRFGNRKNSDRAPGPGFIIDPSGLIVTNNHVVGHADKIVVSLTDGTRTAGQGDRPDELTDVARDQGADADGPLPGVTWGDSRQVRGGRLGDRGRQSVRPRRLGHRRASFRPAAATSASGPFDNFLQLDAPINPGNSGGPVFNMDGQVIGVSTAIVSPTGASVGIGFAIPSELVSPIVASCATQGPRSSAAGSACRWRTPTTGVTRGRGGSHRPGAQRRRSRRATSVVGGQRRPRRKLARADPRRRRGPAGQQRSA